MAPDCSVVCWHIAGGLNFKADQLSQWMKVTATEWSLSPQVVEAIWAFWGRPQMDLFATRDNHKIDTYVSPFLDDLPLRRVDDVNLVTECECTPSLRLLSC